MTDEAAKTGEARHCAGGGSQSDITPNKMSNQPNPVEVAERLADHAALRNGLGDLYLPSYISEDLRTASHLLLSQAGEIERLNELWTWQIERSAENGARLSASQSRAAELTKAIESAAWMMDHIAQTARKDSNAAYLAPSLNETAEMARAVLQPGGEG